MRNLIGRTLLCASLVAILASCIGAPISEKESSFADLFPLDDINESLRLSFIEIYTSDIVEGRIMLTIKNFSSRIMIFPVNYGARGFSYSGEDLGWVEFSNKINFSPEGGIGLDSADNDLSSSAFVLFSPDFREVDHPSRIRIIVVGNPVVGDELSDEEFGAYIDVTLSP